MPKKNRVELYDYLKTNYADLMGDLGQDDFVNGYGDKASVSKLYNYLAKKVPDVFGETDRKAFMQEYGDDVPVQVPKEPVERQIVERQPTQQINTTQEQRPRQQMARNNNATVTDGQYMSFLNSVPTVGVLDYEPAFKVQDLDLKYLDKNQDNFIKIENKKSENAKENLGKGLDALNKALNIRADNPYQQAEVAKVQEALGINESLFDIKDEDLMSDAPIKKIDTTIARLMQDPTIKGVMRDQVGADYYLKEIQQLCGGKDANGELCKLAQAEYQNYFKDTNGSYRADKFNPAMFKSIDVWGTLEKAMKAVPLHEFAKDMKIVNGAYVLEEWNQRTPELARSVIKHQMSDQQFRNNLYAKGYRTEQDIEKLVQDLSNAYTQENLKDVNFKFRPVASSSSGGGSGSVMASSANILAQNTLLGSLDAELARQNQEIANGGAKPGTDPDADRSTYEYLKGHEDIYGASTFLDSKGQNTAKYQKSLFEEAKNNKIQGKEYNVYQLPEFKKMNKQAVYYGYGNGLRQIMKLTDTEYSKIIPAFKSMVGSIELKNETEVTKVLTQAGIPDEKITALYETYNDDATEVANVIQNVTDATGGGTQSTSAPTKKANTNVTQQAKPSGGCSPAQKAAGLCK